MNELKKKRMKAAMKIIPYAIGGSAATSIPIPGVAFTTEIVMTAADILMCMDIWHIYFEEDLSQKKLMHILQDLGLVAVAGVGTAYIFSKVTTAVVNEIATFFGPIGWGVAPVISGSVTGIFGAFWIMYCEGLYRNECSQAVLA